MRETSLLEQTVEIKKWDPRGTKGRTLNVWIFITTEEADPADEGAMSATIL